MSETMLMLRWLQILQKHEVKTQKNIIFGSLSPLVRVI